MGGHGHGGGGHARGGSRGGGAVLADWPLDFGTVYDPGPDIIVLTTQPVNQGPPPSTNPTQQQGVVHGERQHYTHGGTPRAATHAMAPHTRALHAASMPHARIRPTQQQGVHGRRPAEESGSSLHGDTTGSRGNTGEFEPNFGADDELQGMDPSGNVDLSPQWRFSQVDNTLGENNGGLDPFALASFGDDASGGAGSTSDPSGSNEGTAPNADDPTADLGIPDEHAWANFEMPGVGAQLEVEDDFDPIVHAFGRAGTFRTSEGWTEDPTHFGFEPDMFSGFGPAPLMGCDYGKPRG